MWKLRVLQGSMEGQIFELKEGENIVGRLPTCDVYIPANGVSKKHARITVTNNRCGITDLGSSNGTYLNSIKVADAVLRPNDKVTFHNVSVQVMSEEASLPRSLDLPSAPTPFSNSLFPEQQNEIGPPAALPPEKSLKGFAQAYMDTVVLPGLYKVNEIYPTRNILAAFLFGFILVLTTLSSIPMAQLTKEGVQKEGQRRAFTLVKQLATLTERAFRTNSPQDIPIQAIINEDGVESALVVDPTGRIIAPLNLAQTYSNKTFVVKAAKLNKELIEQIDDTSVGTAIPIQTFNPSAGRAEVSAIAIVLYKLNTVDLGSTVYVFAYILIIAFFIGLIVFYFLSRLVTHPLEQANEQLDQALRGQRTNIESPYEFPALKQLLVNVNSALSRMSSGDINSSQRPVDRSQELLSLVRITKDGALALDPMGQFISVNPAFEDITGMRQMTLQGLGLDMIQDQALKLNLEDLFNQAKMAPGQIATSELDIGGHPYEIDAISIGEGSGIYIFATFKRKEAA